jgi:hypothetical protein
MESLRNAKVEGSIPFRSTINSSVFAQSPLDSKAPQVHNKCNRGLYSPSPPMLPRRRPTVHHTAERLTTQHRTRCYMAAQSPTVPTKALSLAPSSRPVDAAASAVQRALDLLGRASSDWRNGGQSTADALHWPVSVNLARRALREALEALEPHRWITESADRDGDARAAALSCDTSGW